MILAYGLAAVWTACLIVFVGLALPPGWTRTARHAAWRRYRRIRPVDHQQMPGHPERLPGDGDPLSDEELDFWRIVEDCHDPELDSRGWLR